MEIKTALCQLAAGDDYEENLRRLIETVDLNDADLYVFPELYLSSYGGDLPPGFLGRAIDEIRDACRDNGCAVCVGAPAESDGLRNSQFFITGDSVDRYDKIHLARFGIYAEDRFTQGSAPVMVEYMGMRIGIEVCYDIMFPEVHRAYAKAGADIVICAAASAGPSRPFMERIGPARSLENTVYTVFLNNIGSDGKGNTFWGGSCVYDPLGEKKAVLGADEGISVVTLSSGEIEAARKVRHHLEDIRRDVDWEI